MPAEPAEPLLTCERPEQAGPILAIAEALLDQRSLAGRCAADHGANGRDTDRARQLIATYLERADPVVGYLTVVLEREAGLRFSGRRSFPYRFHLATRPPGVPLAGDVALDPAPPVGAVLYATMRRWQLIIERDDNDHDEFVGILHPALLVGHRHGLATGLRHIVGLIDTGQILDVSAAASAAATLLRAAAVTRDDAELFDEILGDPPEEGIGLITYGTDLFDERFQQPVPRSSSRVTPLLEGLLSDAWRRVAVVRAASDAGEWWCALTGLTAYLRFVTSVFWWTLASPSQAVEAALDQLDELAADLFAITVAIELDSMEGVIDYETGVIEAITRRTGDRAAAERRFRRERLLVPPKLLDAPLDAAWRIPDTRPANLFAYLTGESDPALLRSPFGRTSGEGRLESMRRPDLEKRTAEVRRTLETADAMDHGRAPEAAPLLRGLLHDYPWCAPAYRMLAQSARRSGNQDEAVTLLVKALTLRPDRHRAWAELGDLLGEMGHEWPSGVAKRVAHHLDRSRP
ncbi:tetratricopeptide repeat protein [Nonomuraea sp. LP-02]|uniref:tetratricopeptide repeat protein n=1 Tax=Nonomuraea sp. LP-02 TaxID=3097960 RepID=UPI002E2F5D1E|nr:tetratricopeptide repeat protein [Nonomuraea sp. LP-02]MED7928878.1 tetratricopeptide repeat protein [Nonomuraea sp. LP-02]